MRILLQRVQSASVHIDGKCVADIACGILAYIGFGDIDDIYNVDKMLQKALNYRIFADDNGKSSLSVRDIDGMALFVPQFTLYARTDRGLRPDFAPALDPVHARQYFEIFCQKAMQAYPKSAFGVFGADMQVHAINDGPMNFYLQS